MALNLLSIVLQENKPIDEEKLKFICSKSTIWDHFKITNEHFLSLSESEKIHMLHRFYTELEAVYYGTNGKNICCLDCVWLDNGSVQNCLKCKVNVKNCSCFSNNEH